MNQQVEVEMHWSRIKILDIKISFPATQWGNLEQLFLASEAQKWDPTPFLENVQLILQQCIDSRASRYIDIEGLKFDKMLLTANAEGFQLLTYLSISIGLLYMLIKDYPTLKNNIKIINEDIQKILPRLNDLLRKEILDRIRHIHHNIRSTFHSSHRDFREIHMLVTYDDRIGYRSLDRRVVQQHYRSYRKIVEINSLTSRLGCYDRDDDRRDDDRSDIIQCFPDINDCYIRLQSDLRSILPSIRKNNSDIIIHYIDQWPNMNDLQRKEIIDQCMEIYHEIHHINGYSKCYNIDAILKRSRERSREILGEPPTYEEESLESPAYEKKSLESPAYEKKSVPNLALELPPEARL